MKKLFLTILFTLVLSGGTNSAEFLKEGKLKNPEASDCKKQ